MDDRAAGATTAPGRRGLSAGAARVVYSVMEAVLADEDEDGRLVPGSRAACERATTWLTRATGTASGDVRRMFGVLAWLLQILPIFVIGRARLCTSLSLAERIRYLEALETSRWGLLTMLLVAFKVPGAIAALEEGDELRSTGFDRPSTTSRRSLVLAPAPHGAHGASGAEPVAAEGGAS